MSVIYWKAVSSLGIPVEDWNSGTGGPNFIKLQSRSQSLEEEGVWDRPMQ